MLTFLPTPYQDEILYSILARYHQHSGNNFINETTQDIYNKNKVIASVEFPCSILSLINSMPKSWGYSYEDFIKNYTLYPLYNHFWDERRSDAVWNLMKGNSVRDVHLKAGIYSNKISRWNNLRFCPECCIEDEKKYGELYWHRVHQTPGTIICPIHKVFICNSKVRLNEINPQQYFTADKNNCQQESETPEFSEKTTYMLIELAKDIEWILNSQLPAIGPEGLKDKYINILRGQGYVGQKGYVNQEDFSKDFMQYYGEEFLGILGLNFNMEDKHNWLSMHVRKYECMPHPVRHLLMIKFLYGSAKDFFTLNHDEKPFGDGPYPCLNAAAAHYLEPVIKNVKFSYSRNKNLFGTFSCNCGFVYTRKGPDKNIEDRFKYSNIITYGESWESKLRELLESESLHLREAAREMKVDLQTVRKLSVKLNIKTEWMTNESKDRFIKLPKCNVNKIDDNKLNFYRNKWLSIIKNHNGLSKTALRNIDHRTYYWLNYHDKEWFDKNRPTPVTINRSYKKVDWMQRDIQIKSDVELIVNQILNREKPERITIDKVGKLLGKTFLLRNHLDKLPITKSYLDLVCENTRAYQIRRIGLVVKSLVDTGEDIKVWKVKQLAGLLNADIPDIIEVVFKEIQKY